MNTAYVGLKSPAATPCTPFEIAEMTTLTVPPPSTTTRTNAPIVGIHLPTEKLRIADHTAIQMNTRAKMYLPTLPRWKKKSLNVVTAVMVSAPPSQIGFESQYRTDCTAATKRPNASLTQM